MYECVKQYCENGDKNGLFLLNMPTGFGKTYSVIKYIFEFCTKEENKNRKVFFITTLKKNLPILDLEKRFLEAGLSAEYSEKVLFLDSHTDTVIEHFTSEVKKSIPSFITSKDEYKRFRDDVEFIQKNKKLSETKTILSGINEIFKTKTEPEFRKMIQEILLKEFNTVQQRLYNIKTNPEWQWLGKLYPSVFTSERQVIFMSMDKFLCYNTTLVERPYLFYNSSILENAIIFIDEFDATKGTVLKSIIENGLKEKIDYIDLFNSIYSALQTTVFPYELTKPSKKRTEGEYKNQSLQSVIDGVHELADEIYDTFFLKYNHKTERDDEEGCRNFLFQDHRFLSILNGRNKFISTNCNTSERINTICFSEKKPDDKNSIQVLLGKLRGFINWFQKAVYILALNTLQKKEEQRRPEDDEFTLEYAVRTVLSLFRLGSFYENYLTAQILVSSKKPKSNIADADYDLTLYENGFRYYSFENAPTHAFQSRMMMYYFQLTPEKILLRICERAKVIGISATATINTVVGNYDLEHLKLKMGEALKYIDHQNFLRLKQDFNSEQSGYDDINIQVEMLGLENNVKYCQKSWLKVIPDNEIAEEIYECLERSTDDSDFDKERYLRISLAYLRFILKEDIKSFLCVLNKHPKQNDRRLDINVLHTIFSYISKYYIGTYNRNSIAQLDGDEYEYKKDEIINRLSNGEKLFVISVYQTIGAGQNLQYPIPLSVENQLIKINNREANKEKDFDAIYLDKPRNLIVNIHADKISEEDFVKFIFQVEFLQENGELSEVDAAIQIKKAFKAFLYNQKSSGSLNNTKGARLYLTQKIIQAIGRICRTSYKQKNIYIYADNHIVEDLDISVVEERILNPEFMALANKISTIQTVQQEEENKINNAVLISNRVNKFINNMLRDKWNEQRMKHWEELREMVLSKPTMSIEELREDFVASQFYVIMPQKSNVYYYSTDDDYKNVQVSFSALRGMTNEVSENAAKLSAIMTYQAVQEAFERRGWATSFIANDCMMSPALFNNIYKGALGEAVGWILFNNQLQIKLEMISEPELFELFDYKVPGLPVYVDFKNWHEHTLFDESQMVDKIVRKAQKCDCKCVIVANILASNNYCTSVKKVDGVKIISCPSLLMQNEKVVVNDNAWQTIRRCINEFKY